MRIVVFATADFAVPSLEALVAHGHEIIRCLTQPDRPQGRGLVRLPSPVKSAARRLALAVDEPQELQDYLASLQHAQPELGVVISYGRLIPASSLHIPRHGMIGVHPSLLPKYRGASPVVWPILNGEPQTGVTIFRLNERLDAGEILLQRRVPIDPRQTTEQLSDRLAHVGAQLLVEAVEQLAQGTAVFTPQDEQQATSTPKLTKEHGRIDWRQSAVAIERHIRAMRPWPGAYTDWHGQPLKLWAAHVDARLTQGVPPGQMLEVSPEGLTVATGAGMLVIEELQLASRRQMSVGEFLAGHRVEVGEQLGCRNA